MIVNSLLLVMLAAAQVTAEPSVIRLGETEKVTVRFRLERCEAPGELPAVSVNIGALGAVKRITSTLYEVDYFPPETRFPQVALIARWCEGASDSQLDFVRLPLLGQTRLPVSTRPGSEVHVEVGDGSYGPVTADTRGAATLDIFIPPGVTRALVVGKDKSGALTQAEVAVDVPAYNRVTVAVSARAVEVGGTGASVEVLYDGDAEPDRIHAVAQRGTLQLLGSEGGRFSYRYLPPGEGEAGVAAIAVTVDGEPDSRATTSIRLTEAPVIERFGVGPRVGYSATFQESSGARVGVDAWMPLELWQRSFAASVGVMFGSSSQLVPDPFGAQAETSLLMVPVTARVGYEVLHGRRYWVHAGLGVLAAYGRYSAHQGANPADDVSHGGFAVGPTGFAAASYAVGPGEAFCDLSYSYAELRTPLFRAQAGGLLFSVGYRFGLSK